MFGGWPVLSSWSQIPQSSTTRSGSAEEIPALRKWGALLLGALLMLPGGVIAALSASGAVEFTLGAAMAGFGVYLIVGAFVPRLLRFGGPYGGPAVSLAVAILTIAATIKFADGHIRSGAVRLAVAAFLAFVQWRAHGNAEHRAARDVRPDS